MISLKDVVAEIAKQITKYRNQAGLSKKEFSKILGVAPSTVSGCGKRRIRAERGYSGPYLRFF
jgi:DNA-binding transcriptional regulator YiaG